MLLINCILLACGFACTVCFIVYLLVDTPLGLGLPICVDFVVVVILV